MRKFFPLVALLAQPLMAAGSAVIVNSGSTNTPGFRIEVKPSGKAEYTPRVRRALEPGDMATKPMTRQIPASIAKRFFADLDACKPLAALPAAHCMKSASFGSTVTIEYAGQKTPDLSCGNQQDSRTRDLAQSADEIVQEFNKR